MSKAMVTPNQFQKLYDRFRNTYGDSLPPIVMYYQENAEVHVYMKFADICWKTKIEVENASKYLSMFQEPIKLQKRY